MCSTCDLFIQNSEILKILCTYMGLGSESPRTHLSPCVLFRYNTKLYIEVFAGIPNLFPYMYDQNASASLTLKPVLFITP